MPDQEDVRQLADALSVLYEGMNKAFRQRENGSELRLLAAIDQQEGSRPSEIADALGVDRSLVTRQIRALEDDGRLEAEPDPRDGRAFVVRLSEAGRAQVTELTELGIRRYMKFVADWDPAEVRELTRLVWKFEASKAQVAEREQAQDSGPGRRRSR